MWRMIVRLLIRLYPSDFRRRFGRDVEEAALGATEGGRGCGGRAFVLGDLVRTLAIAWAVRWAVAARSALRTSFTTLVACGRDARVAARGLWRRPLQGVVVVTTLAVAIGANASIFTVTRALLLDSLPYDAADRLALVERMAGIGRGLDPVLNPVLGELPLVAASAVYVANGGANLLEGSVTSRVRVTQVSQDFFHVLGVELLIGPGFPRDPVQEPAAVLSHALWRQSFGGDVSVIGRSVWMSGRSVTVVGVAPHEVEFPAGTEVWLSFPMVPDLYGMAWGPSVITRMREGVTASTLERALQDAAREARRAEVAGAVPEEYWLPRVMPLREELTRAVRLPLLALSGAASLILVLGCVNVTGMALAQLPAREDEIAVRRALGAGRAHVFAQLFVEMLVPAVVGGAVSVAVAYAAVPSLRALLPAETPGLNGVTLGGSLLLTTAVLTIVAGVASALLPALAGLRPGSYTRTGPGITDAPARQHLQGSLAAMQVALALVLVSSAVLMGRSVARLRDVPLGFDVDNVLTFRVQLPQSMYPGAPSWEDYMHRALAALEAIPGVAIAGAVSQLPLGHDMGIGLWIGRDSGAERDAATALYVGATGGYFQALGIPVRQGRAFDEGGPAADREVMLSESLAHRLFPEGAVVGRRVLVYWSREEPQAATVVGVVADVRRGVESLSMREQFYQPLAASPTRSISFAVRAGGGGAGGGVAELTRAVREALATVDPLVPPFAMRTTAAAVAETLAARRAVAIMSGLFAVAAVTLAALGVYGLLAHSVARRRRELGIRLALGANAGDLVWMVFATAVRIVAPGVFVGGLGALWTARLVDNLVYEVSVTDPATLPIVPMVVVLVVLIATYLPARSAARLEPMAALRSR